MKVLLLQKRTGGYKEDVDEGENRGHAPINVDILMSDKLSETLVTLDNGHASPIDIPSQKNVRLNFSTFSDSNVAISIREIYVRSLGSGGFLRKCQICQILEGKFSQIKLRLHLKVAKITKIAF